MQLLLCPPFFTSSRMCHNTALCHLSQVLAMSCRVLENSCRFLGSSPTQKLWSIFFSLFSRSWMELTTYKPGLYFWHLGLVSTTKIASSFTMNFVTCLGSRLRPLPRELSEPLWKTLTCWSPSKTWRKYPFIFEGKTRHKCFPYIPWLECSQHLFLHQQWVGGLASHDLAEPAIETEQKFLDE